MHKSPQIAFYFVMLLWLSVVIQAIAQSPSTDLDSITEDAYQRMLARQAAEFESDSLRTNKSKPVVVKINSKEGERIYYLIGVFVIAGVASMYLYVRNTSKTNDSLKEL